MRTEWDEIDSDGGKHTHSRTGCQTRHAGISTCASSEKNSYRGFHSLARLISYVWYRANSGDQKARMTVVLRHKHLLTTFFGFLRLLLPYT